jgi:hypothetical protein
MRFAVIWLAVFFANVSTAAAVSWAIYPGGAIGTVADIGAATPEDPVQTTAALRRLSPAQRLRIRLYDLYQEPSDAYSTRFLESAREYATAGWNVDVVLRYAPRVAGGDPQGFAQFSRARTAQLSVYSRVRSIQIGNELNAQTAATSDGAFPQNVHAVLSAGRQVDALLQSRRRTDIQIGVSWAGDPTPSASLQAFATSPGSLRWVDWVGINAYPGTWGPRQPALSGLVASARNVRLALAGSRLRGRPIRITETGWPTSFERTEQQQRKYILALQRFSQKHARRWGVSYIAWFDLRDANSNASLFEAGYGLFDASYRPKAGVATFRRLVET